MGMAAILVMWPGPFIYTFVPPSQGGATYNLALIGQAVSEGKMFKHCWRQRRRQRRQRTPEQGYTISSPCEPDGSYELKRRFSKSVVLFQEVFLFKTPGKSPIPQISEDLCFLFCCCCFVVLLLLLFLLLLLLLLSYIVQITCKLNCGENIRLRKLYSENLLFCLFFSFFFS